MALTLLLPIFIAVAFATPENPEVTIDPIALRSPDGGLKTFVCMFYDATPEQIQEMRWYRRDGDTDTEITDSPDMKFAVRYLTPAKQELSMVINPLEVGDTATYVCKAKYNDDGEVKQVQKEVHVTVAKKLSFDDCLEEQHPTTGEEARITCTLDTYNSDLVTWWTRTAQSVDQVQSGGPRQYEFEGEKSDVLVIPHYDTNVDDGEYVFNAKLKGFINSRVERIIKVSGYVPPVIVTKEEGEEIEGLEGLDLVLSCSATGKPVPQYRWFKGDETGELVEATDKYSVEEGELTIHVYNDDDVGAYTCVAENSVDRDTYHLTTTIYHKPSIDYIANQTTSEGGNVEFTCNYRGDGEVNAYWKYMGNILGFGDVVDNPEDYTGVSKVVSRVGDSLILHINNVQSLDMDEYTCTVENKAGAVTQTAKLFVTRAPVITDYSSEVISWEGNKVDVYCVANSVPAPTWTWYNPQQQLIETDNDHMIVMFDHQQKSVLTITTRGSEYGQFRCVANNEVGTAEATVDIKLIRVPRVPIDFANVHTHPTSSKIEISGFNDLTEEERPNQVQFVFATETRFIDDAFDWDREEDTIRRTLPFNNEANEYSIENLMPETMYHIRIRAGNDAGWSPMSQEIIYTTSSPRQPEQPIFDEVNFGCEDISCEISWVEPDAMGADILGYRLSYVKVQKPDNGVGESKLMSDFQTVTIDSDADTFQLTGLDPSSDYLLKLAATNSIGDGQPGSLFIRTRDSPSDSLSAGGIVGIVLVVLFILLIIVDVTCYLVNQCGLLMCICVNCCGKTPPEVKAKEIAMEEGVKSDKTPLQEKEPEDKNDTAMENTPMIDNEDKVHTSV